jgi:sucrose-6-phosphatase
MDSEIWLFSDLDRTILPNGRAEESPRARPLLKKLVLSKWVRLVYVSGRNEELLKQAIRDYDLPLPAYAIGDVGTTIYAVGNDGWRRWTAWEEEIGRDWPGGGHAEIVALFADLDLLRLQEPSKQNNHKVSYYTEMMIDRRGLLATMRQRLEQESVRAGLIFSIDELKEVGLLDVLPESATKVHAIRFLLHQLGVSEQQVLYAGDSGNDLAALTSGLRAVLVRNAGEDVRQEALSGVEARGFRERLYLPRGDFLGMNGNYTAGVLEGLAHFFPEVGQWLEKACVRR